MDIKELVAEYKEEAEGFEKYYKKHKEHLAAGNHEMACIYKDMAKDEFDHLSVLKEVIHEHAKEVPTNHDEMHKKYMELQKMYDEL